MKKIFCISCIFLLSSCSLDNDYVRKRQWKYGNGYRLECDFITFDGDYLRLKNDTIYIADSAICTIDKTEKGHFGYDNEIHIKSIATNKKGVYHDFGFLKQ